MYHVMNNFVANLDPNMLEDMVFHCWGCSVVFSEFFDVALDLNNRMISEGCFEKYIFLGEHYTTYDVETTDQEKRTRWETWARHFRTHWCPVQSYRLHQKFTTLIHRDKAPNGRNMNGCMLQNTSTTRQILPSLENIAETAEIMCNTKHLISAEGNALTNMILMQPSSTVTVLWQVNRPTPGLKAIYGNMAKLLGLQMSVVPFISDEALNVNCSEQFNEIMEQVVS
jgi:hypothetical protein